MSYTVYADEVSASYDRRGDTLTLTRIVTYRDYFTDKPHSFRATVRAAFDPEDCAAVVDSWQGGWKKIADIGNEAMSLLEHIGPDWDPDESSSEMEAGFWQQTDELLVIAAGVLGYDLSLSRPK